MSCFVCTFNIKGFAAGILVKFYCTFLLYLPRESLSNPTVPFFYTYHRNPCLIVPYLSSIFAPGIFVKLCCIFLLYLPLGSVSNCFLPFCLYVSGIIFNLTVPLFCSHLYVPSVLWIQIRWIQIRWICK